ncbi:MAG: hypothetical protein ABI112_17620 [Terracoccus sp.]
MTDRILLAARNNALWCDAVCRTYGLRSTIDDQAWSVHSRTPPYYPDAVTLSPDLDELELLARIDGSDGASVKDSWSALDLTGDDFARLVVGQWLWHDGTRPAAAQAPPLVWRRVRTPENMMAWTAAWADEPDASSILHPSLLDEPGVHVLAASSTSEPDAPIVAGCIVNVTDDVAGLGNLFVRSGDTGSAWGGAVTAAREVVGGIPIVGWETGSSVDAAVSAGCETIGPLTVWVR